VCDDKARRRTWFFTHKDTPDYSPRQAIEEIQEHLNQYDRIVAHNLKFDYQWLRYLGIDTSKHVLYCTMVAEYLIRGHHRQEGLSLNDLCTTYDIPLKKDEVKVYWEADVETTEIPSDLLQVYCEQDTVNAMALCLRQLPQLRDLGLMKLMSLEMEALRCYADMEWNGMRLDVDLLKTHQENLGQELNVMDNELRQLLNVENLDSPKQLSVALFGGIRKEKREVDVLDEEGKQVYFKSGERAGQKKTKRVEVEVGVGGAGFDAVKLGIPETSTGDYSTSVPSLSLLKAKTKEQKRIVELILERSRKAQMKSTYFDALLRMQSDGYVHPTINQALTKTGRLSCKNPNLQNQPRGNTGPVKECFITRY
jgi:DNA polymerase-1